MSAAMSRPSADSTTSRIPSRMRSDSEHSRARAARARADASGFASFTVFVTESMVEYCDAVLPSSTRWLLRTPVFFWCCWSLRPALPPHPDCSTPAGSGNGFPVERSLPRPPCFLHRCRASFIRMGRVIVVGASTVTAFVMLACGSSTSGGSPTAQDRAAWQNWAGGFVTTVCAHQAACSPDAGRSPGSEHACVETGSAGADMATCDAAAEFYVAHREALEACISNYPASCELSVAEACPTMPAGNFGTLCP